MPVNAQGSQAQLAYVVEVTQGTTPVTPAMQLLPFNTHSLSTKRDTLQSARILANRMVDNVINGNETPQGDIVADLSADDFDDFFAAALFGEWTTGGVLKAGTTPKYFSIEDGQLDIPEYRIFRGCTVNTMNIKLEANQIAVATFGMLGLSESVMSGTPLDASPTAYSQNDVYNSFSGLIKVGGVTIGYITSYEVTTENGIAPKFAIGSSGTHHLDIGKFQASGTIRAYFQDATLYNMFRNSTETDIELWLADGVTGNTLKLILPRVRFTGANLPVDNDQSRVIEMPFSGFYDLSEGTTFKMVKA